MTKCTGLGKWLGHKFQPRMENVKVQTSDDADLPGFKGIKQLMESASGKERKLLASFLNAYCEAVTEKRYVGDVCARCGLFQPAPAKPEEPKTAPITAPTTATIPIHRGIRATVVVGPLILKQ